MKKLVLFLMVGLSAVFSSNVAKAAVELDLLLLVDVSGSVDATEYALQKTGYVNAFLNPSIHAAIASKADGIAVGYAEWSGPTEQALLVGWTHLTDAATSTAFSAAIAATARAFGGVTALGEALTWGAGVFPSPFGDANTNWVIDISGDGADNAGTISSAQGRDAALAAGVDTINGLVILGETGLQAHYQNNVIGGVNPSLFVASSFSDFEAAVLQKIGREIIGGPGGVPEPASVIIWALIACVTIGSVGRVQKKQRMES